MRRLISTCCLMFVAGAFVAPAPAAAQQSLNVYLGGFSPRGEDARDADDVLVNNLDFLSFDVKDFASATFGVEWLVALNDRVEAGLGLGFSRKTVPTVYADFINEDGSEIEQDLKLRMVPFTATVRFLPLGRNASVQPYIGAGVGVISWRYSETGDFIDFNDDSIFRDSFVGSGSNAGPVILGGVRFPVGAADVGGELRYQSAKGELSGDEFFGTRIDLGGFSYTLNVNFRF
jgi:outer membrane protein W